MLRILLILLIFLAPVALFAGVLRFDQSFGELRSKREYVIRIDLPPPDAVMGLPKVQGPLDSSRPLVVIDAGHGGHDPGAGSSENAAKEKDLTLKLALALRDKLLADGGVRVALTRSDDRYLLLEERSGIARKLHADLFISIHADSADSTSASGATVYTLSQKGSSEEAEKLAASENQADMINGVTLGATTNDVSAILVDLSQRQSAAQSEEMARLILRVNAEMAGVGAMDFRTRPIQSAAFVVLKSPDLPSILFEAGYISNSHDAAQLASSAGRANFAEVTARAIKVFFARNSRATIGAVTP
jgi:N-acetylmuramoyl-L-alanine amidase